MFDIEQLLVASAHAQAAGGVSPPGGSGTSVLMNFLPLALIFGVFYILIIRPQQKKMDEQNKMIKALRRGDRVVTSGGVLGKITRLEGDDVIVLEIADSVNIKVLRTSVAALSAKTDPAAVVNDGDEAEKTK